MPRKTRVKRTPYKIRSEKSKDTRKPDAMAMNRPRTRAVYQAREIEQSKPNTREVNQAALDALQRDRAEAKQRKLAALQAFRESLREPRSSAPRGNPGGGAAPVDPEANLAWAAVQADPTTYEMLAQRKGTGTPTFTHTGLLLPDHEGVYRDIPANTAPWHGARVVTNYTYDSNNPVGRWDEVGASTTATYGSPDPDGGNTAIRLQFTAGEAGNFSDNYTGARPESYRLFSVWLKSNTGSNQSVRLVSRGIGPDFQVDNVWRRYFYFNGEISSSWIRTGVYSASTDSENIDILMWHPMLEAVQDLADVPSEYVENVGVASSVAAYANQNGNTVASNVVTEAVGAPLTELPSLYAAPAATNLLLYSNDQLNGNWTKTRSIASLDQVGLTGEPNTATLLVDDGAGGTDSIFVRQDVTLANSNTHTIKVYLKASGLSWVWLQAASFDTNPDCYFDIGNGVVGTANNGGTGAIDDLGNGWYACYLEFSSTTDLAGSVRIYPADADGDQVVDRDGTSSIIIGNAELYEASIAQIRGASALVTAGTSASASAVTIDYDLGNHDEARGGYYVEYKKFANLGGAVWNGIVGATSATALVLRNNQVNINSFDGSSSVSANVTDQLAYNPLGVAYDQSSSERGVRTDQGWGEGTYDGSFGLSGSLPVGQYFNGPQQICLIRNIQRWDLPYTEAKAKIDELMS